MVFPVLVALVSGMTQNPTGMTPTLAKHAFPEISGVRKVVSPYSLFTALGMAAEGGNADARKAINGLSGRWMSIDLVAQRAGGRGADDAALTVGNAIWVAGSLRPTFSSAVAAHYGAAASPLAGVGPINNWVSRMTEGKIDRLFDDLPPGTRVVLVNTLLFDGKWSVPFDPGLTGNGTFEGVNGARTVPMMRGEVPVKRVTDQNTEWVGLSYANSKATLWLALNPDPNGPGDVAQSLNLGLLAEMAAAKSGPPVSLWLPRFEIKSEVDLMKPLRGMLRRPVESLTFDGMVTDGPLVIGAARQVSVLTVDEQGTTAAAATGIAMPRGRPMETRFDRPFVAALVHPDLAEPLIVAQINGF